MSASAAAAPGKQPTAPQRVRFSERLTVPWWGWSLPLVIALLLAAEMDMGYPGLWAWLPYAVMVSLVVVILVWIGRTKVQLTDTELHVADAVLDLKLVDEVEVVPAQEKRRALGPDLDPTAFVMHRGWIGPIVRIYLKKGQDITPYWVFSVRKAETLVAAVAETISAGK